MNFNPEYSSNYAHTVIYSYLYMQDEAVEAKIVCIAFLVPKSYVCIKISVWINFSK